MSKGDRHRSISQQFKSNFDNIKFSGKTKYVNRKKNAVENKSAHIWPDIQPYEAKAGDMAGKEITSRSKHREFLRRNNLIEVGNEKDYFFKHGGKDHSNHTKDWK